VAAHGLGFKAAFSQGPDELSRFVPAGFSATFRVLMRMILFAVAA